MGSCQTRVLPEGATSPLASSDIPSSASDEDDLSGLVARPPQRSPSEASTQVAAPDSEPTQRLYTMQTDKLRITINLDGGDIQRVALLDYAARRDTPDEPLELLHRNGSEKYYARSGYQRPDGRLFRTHFQVVAEEKDTDVYRLRLRHEDDQWAIDRTLEIAAKGHLIEVRDQLTNLEPETTFFTPFAAIYHNGNTESTGLFIAPPSYTGAAYRNASDNYNKYDFDDMQDSALRETIRGGYLALVQHYFVSAWVPDPSREHDYQLAYSARLQLYVMGYTSSALQLLPGEQGEHIDHFFAGPKLQQELEQISQGLELTVDYGFLWWLGQPTYAILIWLHNWLSNWGLAIIFFTVLLKLLIYPLSAAGFRSMAKMRALAPQMEELRKTYGDDRQKMGQKTMELYKTEGVSPFGGCLPLLVPMPIFFALYWVLLESVELRHAPFALWIHDLSAHDPYFVLPLLLGISMWGSQRLAPPPANADPMLRRMMQWMPVVFTLLMAAFPAGLVLYSLVNNLMSIGQQWLIQRNINARMATS